jgi:hypothetical protein
VQTHPPCSSLIRIRAAFHEASKATSLSTYWTSAWNTASRAKTTPSSSRAACHFMDVLLKLNIVPYTAVSDTVQSMMMSIELSGPALLTETSAALMTTLIRERINENPTHYNVTAERVLNWLFSKWTPSKHMTLHREPRSNSMQVCGQSAHMRLSMHTTATPGTCYVYYMPASTARSNASTSRSIRC